MKNALPESKYLFDELMDAKQKEYIEIFLRDLSQSNDQYPTDIIWKMDQEIGGVGGYCMPANPNENMFPGGLDREFFRPLQYVRSEVDNYDIRMHSRLIIQYSGMHLEAVLRHLLKNKVSLGKLKFYNSTLGKAVTEISRRNILDKKLIDNLFKFITLYNRAKHDINMDEERIRLFTPSDAIVCYFSARVIGQVILKMLEYPLSQNVYEIHNESLNI